MGCVSRNDRPGKGPDSVGASAPITGAALRNALEAAGVEFIDENGGGPGVRLRKPAKPKR